MRRLRKYVIAVAAAVLLILCVYSFYQIATFEITFKPITQEEWNTFAKLAEALKAAERYPHREVDNTSVGFPLIERQLLALNQLVNVFEIRFGQLPTSMEELTAIPDASVGTDKKEAKREIRSESRNCRIFIRSPHSYFLNCDGWAPDETSLRSLERTVDARYIRFYKPDAHIVLYVPPPQVTQP